MKVNVNHKEIHYSNPTVHRDIKVNGHRYILEEDEVKMLRNKMGQIFEAYILANIESLEEGK